VVPSRAVSKELPPIGRAVSRKGLADDPVARHRPPVAAVQAFPAVIAHYKVMVCGIVIVFGRLHSEPEPQGGCLSWLWPTRNPFPLRPGSSPGRLRPICFTMEASALPTDVGPVPDRIAIWPMDDGSYGLDATFQGASGYERAERHAEASRGVASATHSARSWVAVGPFASGR
jgi:hypothetical protein